MNQRIKGITDAATLLFLRQGYSKTQISHIAKAAGVSVGTIYLDFTGKKEILHYILKSTIDPDFGEQEFERPIKDELFDGIESEIITRLQKSGEDFAGHLGDLNNYSFKELISDAFDLLSGYAVGCLFIEKNYFDFKTLSDYYSRCREKFFDTMRQYIAAFMEQGTVRPLENLELCTTMIIEILSWWAMDSRYTSFEIIDIPIAAAKGICMDNIISAYQQQVIRA